MAGSFTNLKKASSFMLFREVPVLERVLGFYGNLIQFDHTGFIKDETNPTKRYIRIEKRPCYWLVCSWIRD